MAKVIWHITMSLDGFIAGPGDTMDWVFEHTGPNAVATEVLETTGALVVGRRTYEVEDRIRGGFYGGAWRGPTVNTTSLAALTTDAANITAQARPITATLPTAPSAVATMAAVPLPPPPTPVPPVAGPGCVDGSFAHHHHHHHRFHHFTRR